MFVQMSRFAGWRVVLPAIVVLIGLGVCTSASGAKQVTPTAEQGLPLTPQATSLPTGDGLNGVRGGSLSSKDQSPSGKSGFLLSNPQDTTGVAAPPAAHAPSVTCQVWDLSSTTDPGPSSHIWDVKALASNNAWAVGDYYAS